MNKPRIAQRARQTALMAMVAGTLPALAIGALPAEAATAEPAVKSLKRQIEARDAIIEDLLRRVQELERKTAGPATPSAPEDGPRAAPAAAVPEEAAPSPSAAAPMAPSEEQQAVEAAPTPTEAAPPPPPGQISVTEEEAERALERTLVAVGVLLLPLGQVEVEPAFTYTRRELDSVFAQPPAIDQKIRRNEFRPSISARAGLPFDSQLELALPYNVVQQDQALETGLLAQKTRTETGHSIGDLSVGVAKTVFREKGWRPDLIARFTWDTPTGEMTDKGVPLDGGFNEIIGQLTALKRQDPLAFFASTFYQKAFEKNHSEPGDEFGFSLGAFLATSPETSLFASLDQVFSDDDKVDGSVINDSGQVASVLNLGASSLLAPGVLLQFNVGIGLTEDAPDYTVGISLPIRFGLPGM